MPGTIIFKPIQATLLQDNDLFTKMDTYCTLFLGSQQVNGQVCKSGGKQPRWNDTIIAKRAYEPYCILKIMSKEWLKKDSVVGTVEIDLQEIESKGKISKSYPVLLDNKQPVGEILIESMFAADSSGSYKQTPYQQSYTKPVSPYKEYGRFLYPDDIYSPAKQNEYEHRRIAQVPLSQIPGLEYSHQITFPHISHHLTAQEYSKLHSRQQDERYQPTNKVVRDQTAPPSWPGYESVMVERSPERVENSIGSTMGDTPENLKGIVEPESPKVMSYYPMLGGVRYEPNRGGINYKAVYGKEDPLKVKQKGLMEKFDEVADENCLNAANVKGLETNAV